MSSSDAPVPSSNDGAGPIPLRVEYTRLNSFFADYARNISKGATFVKTDRPLGVGTRFLFVFRLPELPLPMPRTKTKEAHAVTDARELALLGVVRWVTTSKQSGEDKPPGMGIEFLFADEGERAEIHGFVVRTMDHLLGPHLSRRILIDANANTPT